MKFIQLTNIAKTSIIIAACALAFSALANNRAERGEGRPKSPPPEALEACIDKSVGDSVSFETRRGDTITGTCILLDEQLVAVPEDYPR